MKSDFRTGPTNLNARVDVKVIIDKPDVNSIYLKQHSSVVALANTLQWPYGAIKIEHRPRHYGIRDNVIWSWSPEAGDKQYDRVIFLEDDVIVSPFFFQWLLAADEMRNEKQDWVGVSLYKPRWNEVLWSSFDYDDPILLQLPCSWGACTLGPSGKNSKKNGGKHWITKLKIICPFLMRQNIYIFHDLSPTHGVAVLEAGISTLHGGTEQIYVVPIYAIFNHANTTWCPYR